MFIVIVSIETLKNTPRPDCKNLYDQILYSVMQEEAMTVLFIHESFFVYMLFDMSFISTSA